MIVTAIRAVQRLRLRLRAKMAAARFATALPSLRERRRGETAWTRMALRWRHRRLRPLATHRGDTTFVHTTVWQPHVHVHCRSQQGERIEWRDRGSRGAGAPERTFGIVREMRVQTRVVAESPMARVWRTRERARAHAPIESSGTVVTRSTGTERARGVTLFPSAAPAVSRALAGSRRLDWARPSVAGHRVGLRRTARNEAVAQEPLVNRKPLSRHSLAVESAADRGLERSGLTRMESRRRPMPPAQIVWREGAGSRRSSPDVITRAASASSSVTRGSRSSPAAEDTGVNETFAARPRHAAVGLADFEPGLIDRLADDVIRRVERRVRIERERRGIS